MADPIKEFLVSLGFKLDQAGLARFTGALQGTHKVVRDFAVGITAMAAAAEEAIRRTARQYENLFYLSQQTGVAVRDLQQAQFAFSQIGLSAGDATNAISSLATAFKDSPGLRGLAQGLVPGAKDANETVEGLALQYRKLMDQFGESGPRLEVAAVGLRRMIEALHLDPNVIEQQGRNWKEHVLAIEQARKSYFAFGIDSKKASDEAAVVTRGFNRIWLDVRLGFETFLIRTFPSVNRVLTQFADWMENEGAKKIKKWADEFDVWLNKEETIKNIKELLTAIGDIFTTITDNSSLDDFNKGIANIAEGLRNLNDYLVTIKEWMEWAQKPHPLFPDLDKPRGGSYIGNAWRSLFPPSEPNATAPIPPSRGGTDTLIPSPSTRMPGAYEKKIAYEGGGAGGPIDYGDALFRMLGTWLKGDASFRPIVVIAEEFYNKFADMIARVLGIAPAVPEATASAGGSPEGATPGRGGIGPRGGAMRATVGGKLGYTVDEALKIIEKYESDGKNSRDPTSTASGFWKFLKSTWGEVAPKAGIDVNKYPEAIMAPRDEQRKAAALLWEQKGFQPWTVGNARLGRALGTGEGRAGADPGAVMGSGRVAGVRKELMEAWKAAATSMPEGFRAILSSGFRPGDPHYHGKGDAVDTQIFGPQGAIRNRGRDVTNQYKQFTHRMFNYMSENYPDLAKQMRWGGDFPIPGTLDPDIMHTDLGRRSGRGRWYQPGMWDTLDRFKNPLGTDGANGKTTSHNWQNEITINANGVDNANATAQAVKDVLGNQYKIWGRNAQTALT